MTWVEYTDIVEKVMRDYGYKRLHLTYTVTDAPTSYAHKVYTIKPTTPYTMDATGKATLNRKYANFEVMYKVKNNAEFDKAYDDFTDLIAVLPNGNYIEDSPTFDPLDEVNISYAVGRFTLLVSTEVTC